MAAMHDDGEVGFEEGMLWLPSHVLDEACGTKVISFFSSSLPLVFEFTCLAFYFWISFIIYNVISS